MGINLEKDALQTPRQGFTIMETLFALAIIMAMVLIFGATFPTVLHASKMSNIYSQVAGLAQHKIEQIRSAGYTALLTPSGMTQMGIIDAGNTETALPYTASFTNIDHLTSPVPGDGLLPPGSSGTISVCDYNTLNPSVAAGTVENVTVTISWAGGGLTTGKYTTSTLVIQMPHS